ncbi:dihydroorotase [Sphingomonas flavalba]|uniref:dihydroorotase n=1 Tax=Sphingomonas flavalba TaxID=2559804 RepID=UPI00109D8B67|nr:dihydroorotase [Sphingomonas flavalba]
MIGGTLAIIGGKLPDGRSGGVLVEAGRIAAVSAIAVPDGVRTIDAAGAVIAPGIVDLGVFAIDKAAFAAGGITRAALMPDQGPPLDDPALIQRAAAAGKPDVWIHPIAAATRGLGGSELAEIGLMKAAGAAAVATGRHWIADSGLMHRLLAYAAALDLTVIVHSEDDRLVGRAVATSGETATRLGLPSAPAAAEAIAIARDLALVEETGARVHFRQVTTARGLELIRAAKRVGLPVTAGITPAHLLLSDIAVTGFRTFARLSPPLRCEDDRQAALAAVADGTIDVIASGHDPQGPEDKRLPFADATPGMAGAGTLLTLALTLVRDELVSMARLFDLLAGNPARILGVEGGTLTTGAPGDLILFDPEAPWRIESETLVAAAGNTPFDGLPVQGRLSGIIKGGQPIG